MHIAGADRADFHMRMAPSLRENNEYQSSSRCLPDGAKSSFHPGMIDIWKNDDRCGKQALNLGDRNPMFLAFVSIGLVPIKAGKFRASDPVLKYYLYRQL
jgi:hypothetical protein